MHQRYLEITFRNGKPLAAYLYLPRNTGDKSVRTEQPEPGIIIDYAADDRAIGIEILNPSSTSAESINHILTSIHQPPASIEELNPLVAA